MSTNFFKSIYLYVLILFSAVTFFACSETPQILIDVCNTSTDICNVVNGACENVPPQFQDVCNVASDVCSYTSLICGTITQANITPETQNNILNELSSIKLKLDSQMNQMKMNKSLSDSYYKNLDSYLKEVKFKLQSIYKTIK